MKIPHLVLLSVLLSGISLAAQVSPVAALGVVSPQGDAQTMTPRGGVMGAMVGLEVEAPGDGWAGRNIRLRPRVESVWGSSDYAIGDQHIRVDHRMWLGGMDVSLRLPILPGLQPSVFLGVGYAAFENTLAGVIPETKRSSVVAVDGGVEVLPFSLASARWGAGVRARHVLQNNDAVGYDSVSIYALLRF